jgi:hypothetical protein
VDGVVGIEGIRDPVVAVVFSTAYYFLFVSYGLLLITPSTCGLSWSRLSFRILSCITGDVPLFVRTGVSEDRWMVAPGCDH